MAFKKSITSALAKARAKETEEKKKSTLPAAQTGRMTTTKKTSTTSAGSKTASGAVSTSATKNNALANTLAAASASRLNNMAQYSKQLQAALADAQKFAQLGGSNAVEALAQSMVTNDMYSPPTGDVKSWDYDTARQGVIDQAVASDYLSKLGIFDTQEYGTSQLYAHLPQTEYMKQLEEMLAMQKASSLVTDDYMKAMKEKTAETEIGWQSAYQDMLHEEDGDQGSYDEWYNLNYVDWLMGDRSQLFDMEAIDKAAEAMTDEEYEAELARLRKQRDAVDWETVTGSKSANYQSQTGQLGEWQKIVSDELTRRETVKELEALAASDPEYAALSVYDNATASENAKQKWSPEAVKYVGNYDNLQYFVNNPIPEAEQHAAKEYSLSVRNYLDKGYNFLTADEVANYNVLYNSDPEQAQAYLDALAPELLQRRSDVNTAGAEVYATNKWAAVPTWLASVGAGALNSFAVIPQAVEALQGKDNPYSSSYDYANFQQAVRGAQNEALGNIEALEWTRVFGKNLAQHLYGGVSSAADNAARIALGGGSSGATLALAGAQAASGSLQESAERNDMSGAAKVFKALLAAGSEVGTEKIGLDALFDTGKDGVIDYITGVIGSELGEETLNYLGEDAIEMAVSLLFQYEADIKSAPEFWQGLGETAISTLISSGLMGAGGAVSQASSNRATGKAVQKQGDPEKLLEIAKSMPETSKSYTQAQALAAKLGEAGTKNAKMSLSDLGKLTKTLTEELSTEYSGTINQVMEEAITDRLVELGSTLEDATANAPAIRKTANGEKLTMQERARVHWDENADQVTKELAREMTAEDAERTGRKWQTQMVAKGLEATASTRQKQGELADAIAIKKTADVKAAEQTANKLTKGKKGATDTPNSKGISYVNGDNAKGAKSGEILRFEKAEDGSVKIAVKDGDNEQMIDIDSVTEVKGYGTAEIIGYVQQDSYHRVGVEEANAMLHAYEQVGGDAGRFIMSFEDVYDAGYSGQAMPETKLPEAVAKMAYEAAAKEAETSEQQRKEKANAARQSAGGTTAWLGTVGSSSEVTGSGDVEALSGAMERMTESQRTVAEVAQAFAEEFKINTVLFESDAKNISGIQNGSYDRSTHTIYLDINSGAGSAQEIEQQRANGTLGYALIGRTMGHELTHHMENTSAEGYAAYKQAVKEELKAAGQDWNMLVKEQIDKARSSNIRLTRAEAEAEVIADASEYMLQDSKFTKKLGGSLRETVKSFIQGFMEKVETIFRNLTGGHKESVALRKMVDGMYRYTGKLQELWDAGMEETIDYTDSGKHAGVEVEETSPVGKRALSKHAAAEGEAKYPAYQGKHMAASADQSVDTTEMVEEQEVQNSLRDVDVSYNALVSKPDMIIVQLTNEMETLNRSRIVDAGMNNALANGSEGISGMPSVYVEDVGRNVNVSRKSLKHGLDRRTADQSPVIQHIGELLKNSILVNAVNQRDNRSNGGYVLLGAGSGEGGRPVYVAMVVNEQTNTLESFDVLYAVRTKKGDAASMARALTEEGLSRNVSTISIADLLENVKEKFSDVLSDDVISHLGVERKRTEITDHLQYSLRGQADTEEDRLEKVNAVEGVQFSIRELPDGSQYVHIDTDQQIFDNVSASEYSKTARNYIRDRFRNKVIGTRVRAYVRRESENEYTLPAKKNIAQEVYQSKMRAATELDNLLDASTYIGHEEDDGRHPDAVLGWDKYKTIFEVQGRFFEGTVSLKLIKQGDLFYDVTNIKDITEPMRAKYSDELQYPGQSDAVDSIVRPSAENVNEEIQNSLRDLPADVTVRDYLAELTPITRMNETEKILLKRYQETLAKLKEAEKNAAEQDEIIKTAPFRNEDGSLNDDLTKAKNRYQIYRKQADRYARELARAERAEGFAGLMSSGQKLVNEYLGGGYARIADAQDALETEIKGIASQLKAIGRTVEAAEQGQKNAFARGLFNPSELNAAAKTLRDSYASRLTIKEISNRLALAYGEIYADSSAEGVKRFTEAAKDLAQDIMSSSKYRYRSETLTAIAEEIPTISLTETDKQEIASAGLTLAEYKRGIAPFVRVSEGASDLSSYVSNAEAYGGQIANILGTDTEGDLAMALYNTIQAERANETAATFEGMSESESLAAVMADIASTNLPMSANSSTMDYLRAELMKYAGESANAAASVDKAMQSVKNATKKANAVWLRAVQEVELGEKVVDYYRALEEQRRLIEQQEQKKELAEQLKSDAAKKIHEQVEKQREEYREREQRAREYRKSRDELNKLRRRISRNVKTINALRVRETDQKHVPQELQHVADAVMQTFTDSNLGRLAFSQEKLFSLSHRYRILKELENDDAYFWDDEIEADITNLQALGEAYSELKNKEGDVPSHLTVEGVAYEMEILRGVDNIVCNVLNMIDATNDNFLKNRTDTFNEFAKKTGEKLLAHEDRKVLKGKLGEWQEMLDAALVQGNTTPVYFFEHLQNQEMMDVFDEIRRGQSDYARIVAEGKKFVQDAKEKYHYGSWVNDGKLKMETSQKHQIELTREEAAEIYAIAKREANNKLYQTEHLIHGGFQYKRIAEKAGEDTKHRAKDTNHQLDKDDIAKISSWLTDEQKAYADAMVGFLSTTMADYGNQASMDMFGYKKFTESYYIPFHTVANQRFQKGDEGPQGENAGTGRLKSSGFTKKLQHKANQPLVVQGLTDTVAEHIHKMAAYSAMVQPIENMKRLLNHKVVEADGTTNTVRALIGQKYGKASEDYLTQLLKDMNGATQSDQRASALTDKLVGAFKRGAVMASASVVLQQPTAMARAMAYISPKYFKQNPFYKPSKGTWDEMMKYAGTAVIKDMGKFDVGMGLTASSYIADENLKAVEAYRRLKAENKFKAGKAAYDRFMNWLTAAPGVADQWTWGLIWKAVKAEQAALHPDMNQSSEEFLRLCGERFDNVIDRTQVYDSVLTRSNLMRSTNALHKMATSFMSEPTLSLNMLWDAVSGKHTPGERAAIVGSVMASQVLAGALAALVQAWNDDDDERNWLEKYADRATGNIIDNIFVLNMIPYVSDIIGIFQGYDVERMDTAVLSDVITYSKKFVEKITEGEALTLKDWENFAGTWANLTGVPVKNILREIRRTVNAVTNTEWSTPSAFGVGHAMLENTFWYGGEKKDYYQRIATALARGDTELAEDYKAYMLASKAVDEEKLTQGVREAYKEAYERGGIDKDTAIDFLLDNNLVTGDTEDKRKQSAFQYVDEWEEGTTNYSAYNTLKNAYAAISFSDIEKAWKELTNNGYSDDQVKSQSRTLLKELVQDGTLTTGQATQLLRKWCSYKKDSDNTDKPKEWLQEKK